MAKNRRRAKLKRTETLRLQRRYVSVMTWLALLTLTVAPLVFRMVQLDFVSPAITNTTSADTSVMNDTFTHYKMLIYYALAAALVLIFIIKLLSDETSDFRLTRYDAAIAALCVFLLISCILSEYRIIATNGFTYMLDGTFEHICYCALFFFGFHVFSKSGARKWFVAPLIVVGTVNAVISLSNFMGVNMIDVPLIKAILGVPAGAVAKDAKAFSSTFGNINYLSGFGGVLFSVFFARLMFSSDPLRPANAAIATVSAAAATVSASHKKPAATAAAAATSNAAPTASAPGKGRAVRTVRTAATASVAATAPAPTKKPARAGGNRKKYEPKNPVYAIAEHIIDFRAALKRRLDVRALLDVILNVFMIAASFSIIITSLASSGFFTFVIMVPFILVFAALKGVTARKAVMAAVSLAVCALVFAPLAARDARVFDESFGMFKAIMPVSSPPAVDSNSSSATLGVDNAYADSRYNVSPAYTLLAADTSAPDSASAYSSPPAYALLSAPVSSSMSALTLVLASASAPAQVLASASASASANNPDEIIAGFELPSHFPDAAVAPGSGRLYIWKETLRLIVKRPLTGYGMDTLSYAFPQNRLDKVSGLGSYAVFVTKPHNIFIGYAYGAGIPALLAFLALNAFAAAAFLSYMFSKKTAGKKLDGLAICFMLGWVAYLAQGFVNDDLIATAPLFWTMLGIGAGILQAELFE